MAAYTQQYNAGHASVVAGLYTVSAYSAGANSPPAQGRAAIEASLTQAISQGSPQLTIHDISTTELAGGWATGPGRRVDRLPLVC